MRLIKKAGSVRNETLTETAGVPGCAERAALSCKLILTLKSLPQKLLRQSSCCIPNAASAAFFFLPPLPSVHPLPTPPPLFFFLESRVERKEMCIRLVCIPHRLRDSGPDRRELSSSEVPLRAGEEKRCMRGVLKKGGLHTPSPISPRWICPSFSGSSRYWTWH